MGSGFSTFASKNNNNNNNIEEEDKNSSSSSKPSLEDIPESCLALVLACLEPLEICRSAQLNQSFNRASSADFVWESKLPDNYQILVKKLFNEKSESLLKKDIYAKLCSPIRFGGATKEVWLEKDRGGICVSMSWKGMKITGIDDRRYWNHISTHESRFHSIAYLQQIWWLEVDGDLEFHFQEGTYSLFFRLHLGPAGKGVGRRRASDSDQVRGWDIKPVRFQLSTSNCQHATSESYLNERGKWINYHVGDFIVEDSNAPTKIKFSMTQIDCTHCKCGLSLDSVLIRPKLASRKKVV
ncbi:hypothetical protein LguiA_024031 [Lonicera macranthoides]